MDLSGIIKESQLASSIQIGSITGQKAFIDGLKHWSTNPAEIQYKSNKLLSFRKTIEKNTSLSTKLRDFYVSYVQSETIIETIREPPTEESKESKSQLVFTHPDLKPLNFAPFLLLLLYIMKTFVAPTFAILMPLILIVAPYFVIKHVYKMDIDFAYYWNIIQEMIIKKSATTMEKLQRLGHIGWVAVGIGQNMFQPVFTAMHIYKLNNIYSQHYTIVSNLYIKWREILDEFAKEGWHFSDKSYAGWFAQFGTDSRMFLAGIMEPLGFNCWIREVGQLHVLYHMASNSDFNSIKTIANAEPYIKLIDAFDPQIPAEARRPMTLMGIKNALLTGPNRGGKSTALRAILVNVLLAQTYGCCLAKSMELAPFNWIHTCLRLEDIPGNQSLFEREVYMAARSLRRLANNQRGLVLIDELFHSTNPSDSNRAAKIYTNKLWQTRNCMAIISTHDFDLVRNAPEQIQRLCCPAKVTDTGAIEYSYSLCNGVCDVSSVDEILIEKGVVASAQI
jgi:hypothetical protein